MMDAGKFLLADACVNLYAKIRDSDIMGKGIDNELKTGITA